MIIIVVRNTFISFVYTSMPTIRSYFFRLIALLIFGALFSACQKEQNSSDVSRKKIAVARDSSLVNPKPDNYLASGGTLTLQVGDSTYTFNADKDSVAFVNIRAGVNDYFGITAINKVHTISFAISSSGTAVSGLDKGVEGSQLLLRPDAMHIKQYSLTPYAKSGDSGVMQLRSYRQDSVLAKGSFFTFLALDDKADTPFIRVDGTFDLKLSVK